MLIVFSGLPGSGKSTLALGLAAHLNAVYLRLDTIEAALLNTGLPSVGIEGYAVAYALAADALRLGQTVVADCVNPLPVTREAWQAVAREHSSRMLDVEVICSDVQEHQRRVETRQADEGNWAGRWKPPMWEAVARHDYEPWTSARMVIDTVSGEKAEHLARVLALVQNPDT
ncbi:AAA family ATPase [Deinococcus sp. QL22]|uniref:AAA family ATPase n=1 Tax=Deinococcus sp. QL22 TaxID=2939437 RepID=UPI0020178749|nr:AAA family ATPase [Deinococcus sp. QL22]UQN07609.1 AAA family ATPase [Deinococcus sp. QL22]